MYDNGDRTGNKLNAIQARTQLIQNIEEKKANFNIQDVPKVETIQGYFSRLTQKKKKESPKNCRVEDENGELTAKSAKIACDDEDAEAAEISAQQLEQMNANEMMAAGGANDLLRQQFEDDVVKLKQTALNEAKSLQERNIVEAM